MSKLVFAFGFAIVFSVVSNSLAEQTPDQLFVELQEKQRAFSQWVNSGSPQSEEVRQKLDEIDDLTERLIHHPESTVEQQERAIYRGRFFAYGNAVEFDEATYLAAFEDAVAQVVAICRPGSFRPALAESALIRRNFLRNTSEGYDRFLERMRTYAEVYPDQVYGPAVLLRECTSQLVGQDEYAQAVAIVEEVKSYYTDPKVLKRLEYITNRITLYNRPVKLSGPLISGKPFDVSSLNGKVVLVDFWATWCAPCIALTPKLKTLYGKYHDHGFEIVGVSYDKSVEPLKEYVEAKQIPWFQIYDPDEDERMKVAEAFGVLGIPALFLVDRNGILRKRSAEDLEVAIEAMLHAE